MALEWMLSERLWLAGQVRWAQLRRGDIWYVHVAPWLALLILLLRSLVQKCATGNIAHSLGVQDRRCSTPPPNPTLQAAFTRSRRPDPALLAKELGWRVYRVRRWIHRARNCHKPSRLTKFGESWSVTGLVISSCTKRCIWRFFLYTFSTVYGFSVLVKEPFFGNLFQCYVGYPESVPSSPVMSYWCLQLALYCSEVVSHLTGSATRRKDFIPLLLHHAVTIALLLICYVVNMVNIGVVIALLHDVADIFLELAKVMVYVGCPRLANAVFCVFSAVFIITRLLILPNWVLPSLTYDLPQYTGGHSPVTRAAIALLVGLLCLHVYWLYMIGRVALQLLSGSECKDSRSDSELSSSDQSTESE